MHLLALLTDKKSQPCPPHRKDDVATQLATACALRFLVASTTWSSSHLSVSAILGHREGVGREGRHLVNRQWSKADIRICVSSRH